MDPVLPFRALSPGSRNPKIGLQRNRETKLSLKSQKGGTSRHDGKENKVPLTKPVFKKPNFRLSDSDLITSDESDSSDIDVGSAPRQQSIMSTQESTFSQPIAESTRCELPSKQSAHVESTVTMLHTARNSSSSSSGTEYHTAYPFPVGCDESIICISDSSPEPVKKTNKISASVLLTSDESDSECHPKTRKNIFSSLKKCDKKKLCDTVLLESSDEDNCRQKSDIIIPPSVGSPKSSRSSLGSSTSNRSRLQSGPVIPPSPERYSGTTENASLMSDDGVKMPCGAHQIKHSQGTSSPSNRALQKREQCNKVVQKTQESPKEPDMTESSWKDDFRLVMEESIVGDKGGNKCGNQSSTAKSATKGTGSISKEKYNDIARWLISGRSTESDSDSSASGDKRFVKQVDNLPDHAFTPQSSRLPSKQRYSSGSESDDNFEALMASIRKKRNEDLKKSCLKSTSKNDSFINDEVASDVVESPSFNIYHSDITRSIKAEVKSVKKSSKSITKKKLFGYGDEIEENQYTPVEERHKNVVRKQTDSLRKGGTLNSECEKPTSIRKNRKKSQDTESDFSDSDADFVPPPTRGKTAVNKKTKLKRSAKRFNSVESSDTEDSSDNEPVKSNAPRWRTSKAVSGSGSDGSGSNSSSKSDLPEPKPKKTPLNLPKAVAVLKTPKTVAALKSPQTPYSPIRTFLSSLSGPTHDPGVRDHPEAVIYNKNFKGKKEELTRRLFKLFNREVFDRRLPDDMVLEWNARLVRTAGLCYCKLIRKGGVTSRTTKIDLSTKVITSPDRLRDTLIHEMCHAAVWMLNNVSGGHGPFWKAWAHKAMKRFPELPPIERCHTYNIETKYTYRCTKCGYSFGRHSKSLDLDTKRCGYCYGAFEVFLSSKGQTSKEKDLKTPKAPNAFALFVKENYGLVKQDHSDFKHGDIMKKLSEKFAEMKVLQSAS